MATHRSLVVTADDFGIGPATSRAILELAAERRITATVLLVNSPYAEEAVDSWRKARSTLEVGWHPCLTLDRPLLPPQRVRSLVDTRGRFLPPGRFLRKLRLGQVHPAEAEAELAAQLQRFRELVGAEPTVVDAHDDLHVFPPLGMILAGLFQYSEQKPYVRRVREPLSMILRIPGARVKRLFLSALGRSTAGLFERKGFPSNDWLAGVTTSPCVAEPHLLSRWLTQIPGTVVELSCHPGYCDSTLLGRDRTAAGGKMQRRVRELHLLRLPSYSEACRQAGFTLTTPGELLHRPADKQSRAA